MPVVCFDPPRMCPHRRHLHEMILVPTTASPHGQIEQVLFDRDGYGKALHFRIGRVEGACAVAAFIAQDKCGPVKREEQSLKDQYPKNVPACLMRRMTLMVNCAGGPMPPFQVRLRPGSCAAGSALVRALPAALCILESGVLYGRLPRGYTFHTEPDGFALVTGSENQP